MRRFLIRRSYTALLTLLIVSVVVFGLARVQGDPRNLLYPDLNINLAQETWDAFGKKLGLDKPLVYQYALFLGRALKGDFGKSIWRNKSVSRVIWERMPASAMLAAGGFLVSLLGVPLGILSAVKRGSIWDLLGRTIAVLGQSMPSFWVGIMFIFFFSVQLELLPTFGRGGIDHFILPCLTLGIFPLAALLRLIRSSMLDVVDSEFIKLARAKGVSSTAIIWKHALRNALIVPMTFAGILIAGLLTGSIVVETVFAWPGIGMLAIGAVQNADYAVTQGVVLVWTAFFVLSAFFVDLLYVLVDPRIRIE